MSEFAHAHSNAKVASHRRCLASRLFTLVMAALLLASPGLAKAEDTEVSPHCQSEAHALFDFWIGDWLVYDTQTDELSGFDRITKTLDGCAVRQQWTQLNDRFRPAGAAQRLRGESLLVVLNNGQWHQSWVDSSGFSVTLSGGPEGGTGSIVLRSGGMPYPTGEDSFIDVFFRWHWQLDETGAVRSWGFTKVGEDGVWEPSFDNIYRRNA